MYFVVIERNKKKIIKKKKKKISLFNYSMLMATFNQ